MLDSGVDGPQAPDSEQGEGPDGSLVWASRSQGRRVRPAGPRVDHDPSRLVTWTRSGSVTTPASCLTHPGGVHKETRAHRR